MKAPRTVSTDPPLVIDLYAAADLLGISFWTLRQFVADGLIPVVQYPSTTNGRSLRRRLVLRSDVLKFAESHRQEAA